jgi:hypothetical protein
LLKDVAVTKETSESSEEDNSMPPLTGNVTVPIVTMNVERGPAGSLFNKLTAKRSNQLARQEKLDAEASAAKHNSIINRTKKMTSGALVGLREHRLTKPVLEQACAWTEAKAKKNQASVNKKRSAEEKLHQDVAMVRNKPESQWKLKDYKVLSTYKKQKGDSPLKTKLLEAQAQYVNRKDRVSPAKPTGYQWKTSLETFIVVPTMMSPVAAEPPNETSPLAPTALFELATVAEEEWGQTRGTATAAAEFPPASAAPAYMPVGNL